MKVTDTAWLLMLTVAAGACSHPDREPNADHVPPSIDGVVADAIAKAGSEDGRIENAIAASPRRRVGCAATVLAQDPAHSYFYAWLVCTGPPSFGNISTPVRVTMSRQHGGYTVDELSVPSNESYKQDLTQWFPRWLLAGGLPPKGLDLGALASMARKRVPS